MTLLDAERGLLFAATGRGSDASFRMFGSSPRARSGGFLRQLPKRFPSPGGEGKGEGERFLNRKDSPCAGE